MIRRVISVWISFWKDEVGQATTEYMLILAIMVGFLVAMVKKLIKPAYEKLIRQLGVNLEQKFFGGNLHSFRIRR